MRINRAPCSFHCLHLCVYHSFETKDSVHAFKTQELPTALLIPFRPPIENRVHSEAISIATML